MLKVAAGFALANVVGLSDLQITATTTDTENGTPSNYSSNDVAIGSTEVAVFSIDRISIA